jgi:hypothetical protein
VPLTRVRRRLPSFAIKDLSRAATAFYTPRQKNPKAFIKMEFNKRGKDFVGIVCRSAQPHNEESLSVRRKSRDSVGLRLI